MADRDDELIEAYEEIDRLRQELTQREVEVPATVEGDGLTICGEDWAAQLLVQSLADSLRGVTHFIAADVQHPTGKISVVIRRVGPGEKSVAERIAELERTIDGLISAFEECKPHVKRLEKMTGVVERACRVLDQPRRAG